MGNSVGFHQSLPQHLMQLIKLDRRCVRPLRSQWTLKNPCNMKMRLAGIGTRVPICQYCPQNLKQKKKALKVCSQFLRALRQELSIRFIFLIILETQAQIFAVKVVVNTLERDQMAFLEDVGVRGVTNIELKQGCGFFNGIRFLSTSYNNEGVKFYLLIIISSRGCQSFFQNILCSVISPPIFVDSRKSARDYQQKRFMSFVQLFHPSLFSKQFTKRETKNQSDMSTKIGNNMEGLFNYLTAPNIRHKVKHPLFLSVKFSNVVKILYNTEHEYFANKELTVVELLRKFQKKLAKEIGGEKKSKRMENEDQKPFIISVIGPFNSLKKSKINECLEYLECQAIHLAQFSHQIGPNYKDIAQQADIITAFSEIYEELQKISNRQKSFRRICEQISKDSAIESLQSIQIKAEEQIYGNVSGYQRSNSKLRRQSDEDEDEDEEEEEEEEENENEQFSCEKHNLSIKFRRKLKTKETEGQPRKMKARAINAVNSNALSGLRAQNYDKSLESAFNLAIDQSEFEKVNNFPDCRKSPHDELANRANRLYESKQKGPHLGIKQAENVQMQFENSFNPNLIRNQCFKAVPSIPHLCFLANQEHGNIQFNQSLRSISIQRQALRNEMLAELNIQNNFLKSMLIANEMMKAKIEMMCQLGSMGSGSNGESNSYEFLHQSQLPHDLKSEDLGHLENTKHDRSQRLQLRREPERAGRADGQVKLNFEVKQEDYCTRQN